MEDNLILHPRSQGFFNFTPSLSEGKSALGSRLLNFEQNKTSKQLIQISRRYGTTSFPGHLTFSVKPLSADIKKVRYPGNEVGMKKTKI